MNFVDIILILLFGASAYFWRLRGSVRQFFGLIGILVGAYASAYVYSLLAFLTGDSALRVIILAAVMIGTIFLTYDLTLILGDYIQRKTMIKKFRGQKADIGLAAFFSGLLGLSILWIIIVFFGAVLPTSVQAMTKTSFVLNTASATIPLPKNVRTIGQLLKPFQSPDVFVGAEPNFETDGTTSITQQYEKLDKSIKQSTRSIAKITSWGCGSIASGSGFLVEPYLVATNAHVVAGNDRLTVQIGGKTFGASVVFFDPELDFAVLRTAAKPSVQPLALHTDALKPGMIAAVLGFPGGGSFMAGDVTVLSALQAQGSDIYNEKSVVRQIYAVRGDVVPGNSGGPLITNEGKVAGVIFGHSTTANKTGYAIASYQITSGIKAAHDRDGAVKAGSCAG